MPLGHNRMKKKKDLGRIREAKKILDLGGNSPLSKNHPR
jgi:hypothetical protein